MTWFKKAFWIGAGLAVVAALASFTVDELKTSRLQSALWRDLASGARFSVDAGASDAVLYGRDDWVEEVKRLTGGQGVDVVYDSVGQATFTKGLDCLKMRGMSVLPALG